MLGHDIPRAIFILLHECVPCLSPPGKGGAVWWASQEDPQSHRGRLRGEAVCTNAEEQAV